ncbi:hypothetical protein COLSTE_00006 [Collinsella stercoris DSM 13279]|uniref:Uncharacterized protein n=1 Tax=Collinsella stercoris DSM 13279 TaxID=445975 RepID=B6G7G7_9ACTN|nr:hypothetical protein COLSTE_00006 [Collinsella stercoris DSM 13279]
MCAFPTFEVVQTLEKPTLGAAWRSPAVRGGPRWCRTAIIGGYA